MKNKDQKHNIRKAEREYLKKLEESITGRSSDDFYIIPQEEMKKKKQLEILRRVYDTPPENGNGQREQREKEPPRISIEAVIGEEETSPESRESPGFREFPELEESLESGPVDQELLTPSVPIEAVIQDISPPPQEIVPVPEEPSVQAPVISVPAPQVSPQPQIEPPPPLTKPLFEMGTIILLDDETIGIYKGPISKKEYHLIYHLHPDGTIAPEGLYLYAYRTVTLGRVSSEVLDEMQRSMRWERDRIVDNLGSEEKDRIMPLLSSRAIKKTLSDPSRKRNSLERGRVLQVKIGDKLWEAVYWGSDELGQIVAHNTNKVWMLMHLNLGRFGDALQYGDLLSPDQIKNINISLTESLSVGD